MNPGLHPIVPYALALIGLASARLAAADAQELISLHVCNEGSETVFAMTADHGGGHLWQVLGWLGIPPGDCNNIYASEVPNVDPVYVGFAVRGPNGRLNSVGTNVPQYGDDGKGHPTFTRLTKSFCVVQDPEHASIFKSDAEDDATHCGDWVNKTISDPAKREYAAYEATLYFQPKPGHYYLDLRHAPGDSYVSLARGLSPDQKGWKLIGQFLVALGKAARESEIARQKAELQTLRDRFARYRPGSAASWAEKWANAPHVSPADYDSTHVGETAIFTGTISRFTVDSRRYPHWLTINFRESANDAFVVCSPYPDMFQEVVGLNLNALIGKELEVIGPIERAMCTGGVPAGSVRVVESGMVHLR